MMAVKAHPSSQSEPNVLFPTKHMKNIKMTWMIVNYIAILNKEDNTNKNQHSYFLPLLDINNNIGTLR